jgi:hypothetical protein
MINFIGLKQPVTPDLIGDPALRQAQGDNGVMVSLSNHGSRLKDCRNNNLKAFFQSAIRYKGNF